MTPEERKARREELKTIVKNRDNLNLPNIDDARRAVMSSEERGFDPRKDEALRRELNDDLPRTPPTDERVSKAPNPLAIKTEPCPQCSYSLLESGICTKCGYMEAQPPTEWTTEPPTEPGYYWLRWSPGLAPFIAYRKPKGVWERMCTLSLISDNGLVERYILFGPRIEFPARPLGEEE